MARIRGRDVRAMAFCAVVVPVVYGGAFWGLHNHLYALAVTAVFAVWLFTRPRMVRVFQRLRGEDRPGWSNYFQE